MVMKLTRDISSEDLEEIALRVISVVDYDIEKECRNNLAEEGEDSLVFEMMDYLYGLLDG
jgi:hypothetical protein